MKNKLYMITVTKQEYNSKLSIIDCGIFDTIEEGIRFGKIIISDDCYNNSPNDLDVEDIPLFIKQCKDIFDIDYKIRVSVVSTDRKRFNTSKELMDYFNSNIKNISNDNLYDFLLSLVESDDYTYDYNDNLLYHHIEEQRLVLESWYSCNIEFDMELCKQGKYTFEYHYEGE